MVHMRILWNVFSALKFTKCWYYECEYCVHACAFSDREGHGVTQIKAKKLF